MELEKVIENIKNNYVDISDWASQIDESFSRNLNGYNSFAIEKITVNYDTEKYILPLRIVFLDNIVRNDSEIDSTHIIGLKDKEAIVTINKQVHALSFYKRTNGIKYSGKTSEIINDAISNYKIEKFYLSKRLENEHSDTLFFLDSNLNWGAFIAIIQCEQKIETSQKPLPNELNDYLHEFGINYKYSSIDTGYIFIFFPVPYIKIVSNKIVKKDREILSLVLEYNFQRLAFIQGAPIVLKCLIKSTNNNVIFNDIIPLENKDFLTFLPVEIVPSSTEPIGSADITVLLNKIEVERSYGTYIRQINIDIKVK